MSNKFIKYNWVFANSTATSVNNLKAGDVAMLSYSLSLDNKTPTVIILNPRDENNLLHCLVLDYMSPNEFEQLTKQIANKMSLSEHIRKNTGKGNFNTYYKSIKKYITSTKQACYRTYKISTITSAKLLS
jgi:DNA-binding GntR family transcriptional regulator